MTTSSNGSSSSVLDDKIALISVSISTFGGYRRATREQIKALGGNLPSCKAITEGSIKVFKTEALSPFGTIRRNLFRKLSRKGVKALGSSNVFAIPRHKLGVAEQEILDAEREFYKERADLDSRYDDLFEAHVKANSEAEALIRLRKFARPEAIGKLRFSSSVFRIQPMIREGENVEDSVQGIVQGLARQLYEEIASDMQHLLENDAFAKRARVGQKSLRPVRAAVEKMEGLTFLDDTIESAITLVGDVLDAMPKQGYIEDTSTSRSFAILHRLVEVMAEPDEFLSAASKVRNGVETFEVLFPIPAVQAQPAVMQQPAAPASSTVAPPSRGLPPLPIMPSVARSAPVPSRASVPMF